MKIVKYCKEEHNVALGCNTLQLGTFQHYRELDPEFSISDENEGYIHYLGPESEITIDAEQLNAITGGVMAISDTTTAGNIRPPKIPGSAEIKMADGEFVFGEDGKFHATVNKNLEVKLYYPNSYIFCASILDGQEKPNPEKISPEYNSAYEIKKNEINSFIQTVIQSLMSQISLFDLKKEGHISNKPLQEIQRPFNVICAHRPVDYVSEKKIRLSQPSDFTKNRFLDIYFDSIFKKHESYANDREYRFVFFIRHSSLDFLSVQKEPKRLDMKPISNQILAL